MPSIKELVESGADVPQWLLDATVENEDVSLDMCGNVVWNSGTWIKGTWERGAWLQGTWEGGIWKDGIWKNGTWKSGVWKDGIWRNGTWISGMWGDGFWGNGCWKAGIWRQGTWLDGVWESGTWYGGIWERGTWVKGATKLKSKYDPTITSEGSIRVGCETKTPEEWLEWLASDKEYGTPRGTPEFKLIEAHLRAAIAYLDVINGTERASSVFSLQGFWKAIKRKLNK